MRRNRTMRFIASACVQKCKVILISCDFSHVLVAKQERIWVSWMGHSGKVTDISLAWCFETQKRRTERPS